MAYIYNNGGVLLYNTWTALQVRHIYEEEYVYFFTVYTYMAIAIVHAKPFFNKKLHSSFCHL